MSSVWDMMILALYMVGATALLGFAAWLYPRRERFGPAGGPILTALSISAFWGLAVVSLGGSSPGALIFLSLSYLAWFWSLYCLFAHDGRHASVAPIRPVVFALAFVELLQLGLVPVFTRFSIIPDAAGMIFDLSVTFRLLCAVGALVLVHNLYVGASPTGRMTLRWPAAALAVMWLYDLNFYTIAYLSNEVPKTLEELRGVIFLIMVALLALGAVRGQAQLRLRPSRSVAFQSFSLLLIGGYLITMVLVAQALAYVSSDFVQLIQLGFLAVASALALLILPSRRLRSWIRVVLAKHLFQHRYDYRAEWLRFTETIARGGEVTMPLHERVVQAVADITDSPAGFLLTENEDGGMSLDSRWQWPEINVPAVALSAEATEFFEREQFILDLDDVRAGLDARGESALIPQWLRDQRRAWAMVPLIHYQHLVGVVVVARPAIVRKLDWEDFDLLGVVGQQLASYLAEQAGQEALSEAHRFDEFNRRIAFVMHDIKNLASQLSLLARNEEKHAEKPEFREDMLVTLRNSADKLNGLLARLGRHGQGSSDRLEMIDAAGCVAQVLKYYEAQHPVMFAEQEACVINTNPEALEQALVHLVQNAIDASAPDSPVVLSVISDGLHCRIDVVDSGAGMSSEFIRSRLFKPFHSSKPDGFGIGAFEARELIRGMQGRLDVESREGLGTRFSISLPLNVASDMRDLHDDDNFLANSSDISGPENLRLQNG